MVSGPFGSWGTRFRNGSDLIWLQDHQVQEGDRLEYKRDMYGSDDDGKREMLRDVTSIANHHGGHLLIGIEEDADGAAAAVIGVDPPGREPWDS